MERKNLKHNNLQKFKKLRTTAAAKKRHFKIELLIKLSVSRLFHVLHVVQNRRSPLSLAWHEWFSRNERFTAAGSPCRQNFKYVNFITSFGGLSRQTASKRELQVQHDYFSLFNQFIKSLICGVVVAVAAVVSLTPYY